MSTQSHKLIEARAALAAEADALLNNPDATASDLDRVETIHTELTDLDARIAKVEAVEARTAEIAEARAAAPAAPFGGAVVKREAMTYAKDGSNSFVRDMINATIRNERGAWDRLHRHQQEALIETRVTPSTTDGQGGEFVPPLWLTNEYAEYARAARVTANLLSQQALPAGTDSINIPKITLGTQVGAQATQNSAGTKRDMTTSTVTAAVRTLEGREEVSIQLVEQSPLAGGLDRMIFGDLMADYALQVNTQVINGVAASGELTGILNVSGIQSVTYTDASPTGPELYPSFGKLVSSIVKNRYRAPEAFVMHPSTWYWLQGQLDGSNRPLVVPTAAGPFNAAGVVSSPAAADGLAGTVLGVPVYVDATVPTNLGAGTNEAAIIAGKFSDSYLFESGMKTRVLPDVLSANLTVRFQVYGYVALAHRFAAGLGTIGGTGLIVQSGF